MQFEDKTPEDRFYDCITDINGRTLDVRLYKANNAVNEIRIGFVDSKIRPIYITYNKSTSEWCIRQLDEIKNDKRPIAWISGRRN